MVYEQVKFKDYEGNVCGGILINNEFVICGCCGGAFPVEEIEIINKYGNYWMNFSEIILGN